MLLSTSYAWYQFDNAVTSLGNISTFSEDIETAVIFTNNENINMTVGVPLTTDQVDEYSEKSRFTVTASSDVLTDQEVAVQIALINLDIDSELTAGDDLKYSLIETAGSGTATEISSGSFYNITDDTLIIKSMSAITIGTTYSYEFRIWLEETGEDQNSMMGKKITGKIKVSTAIR